MKREEFFKQLREKLAILNKEEIDDIIEEYEGYIDEKMKNGATEEDAIKDFGDIDELATELLKAYKINVEKNNAGKNWFNTAAQKLNGGMDWIVQFFSGKDFGEILRFIIEIFLIILGIWLCKIPFDFLISMGKDMFRVMPDYVDYMLTFFWSFIVNFAYVIFAVLLFVKIFERRYLEEENERVEIEQKETEQPKEKSKKKSKEERKEQEVNTVKPKKTGLLDFLTNVCIWFLKFIAFWILFGIAFYILGFAICLGICIYLMVQGVMYLGIYLSIFILLILGILAFILLFNWIGNRKTNGKVLLTAFLISFVLLGISMSYASIEVANTEYTGEYRENYEEKTMEETLAFEENMVLIGSFDYEVDNSLTDTIKVTYTYNDGFYEIESNIQKQSQNRVYIDWTYTKQFYNNKILKDIIEDLKEHKLHNYTFIPSITITTSANNIEKLKENKRTLNSKGYLNESLRESCERRLDMYGYSSLSETCKELLDLEEDI